MPLFYWILEGRGEANSGFSGGWEHLKQISPLGPLWPKVTLSIENSVAGHFKEPSYLNSSWSQVLSCIPMIQPSLTKSVTPWM